MAGGDGTESPRGLGADGISKADLDARLAALDIDKRFAEMERRFGDVIKESLRAVFQGQGHDLEDSFESAGCEDRETPRGDGLHTGLNSPSVVDRHSLNRDAQNFVPAGANNLPTLGGHPVDTSASVNAGRRQPQSRGTNSTNPFVVPSHSPRVSSNFEFMAFSKRNPDFWFNQIELKFADDGITSDSARYWAVLRNIPHGILDDIAETISAIPQSDRYQGLKKALIARFAENDDRKLERLFGDCTLGDLTPSQLLHRMKALGGSKIASGTILRLWWRRLPDSIANAIDREVADQKESEAATRADFLFIRNPREPSRSQVSVVSDFSHLKSQIAEIVSQQFENRGRSQSRGHSRGRSRSRSEDGKPRLCYPHFKYREDCKFCRGPPCPMWSEFARKHSYSSFEEYKKARNAGGN